MKPLFPYLGGKSRELKHIIEHLPLEFDTYIEPFFGGGALFFYVAPNKSILADSSEPLRLFYEEYSREPALVAAQFNDLHEQMISLPPDEQRAFYTKIQEDYFARRAKNPNGLAALFFFVGKHSFMCRAFTAPLCKNGFNYKCSKCIVSQEQATILSYATWLDDFRKAIAMAQKDDFIFLDPPYPKTDLPYFNNQKRFDENDANSIIDELAELFPTLKAKTLLVVNKIPKIEALFKDYIIDEFDVCHSRIIGKNNKKQTQYRDTHLIIKNY